MRLKTKSKICVGCRICSLTCANRRDGAISSSRIRIVDRESLVGHDIEVCVQCKAKLCIKSCAVVALSIDNNTGATIVDAAMCNGCGECVKACKFGGIALVKEKAIICDLCGGDPQCVKVCPADALKTGK